MILTVDVFGDGSVTRSIQMPQKEIAALRSRCTESRGDPGRRQSEMLGSEKLRMLLNHALAVVEYGKHVPDLDGVESHLKLNT